MGEAVCTEEKGVESNRKIASKWGGGASPSLGLVSYTYLSFKASNVLK